MKLPELAIVSVFAAAQVAALIKCGAMVPAVAMTILAISSLAVGYCSHLRLYLVDSSFTR